MSEISLQDVTLSYSLQGQDIPVLRGLNLNIRAGEMVAILGPSGSGKSTLLYILGCMLKPTSGSYKFANIDTTRLSEPGLAELRNRHFGFVFQQFHLLPRANLIQNLLLGSRYNRGETRTSAELTLRARELLAQVGLESHLKHFPNQLSGGQQQRVAIARALMNDPSLILADEPTGNLDSKTAAQVLDLLRSIHQRGKTIVIITHDKEIASRCDRVISVLDGKIVSEEIPTTLSNAPAAPAMTRVPHTVSPKRGLALFWQDTQTAWQNLMRNKSRSLLTMLGVIIGVAAVLSTVTLGDFTQRKILEGYESLGVNKLVIRAYPRWNLKASEMKGAKFQEVNTNDDIKPLRRLFPEIVLASPVRRNWVQSIENGGRSFNEGRALGVGEEYFAITNRRIALGRPFSSYHVKNNVGVCVIGFEVAQKLFSQASPLGQVITLKGNNDSRFSCRVTGVMAAQSSNNEWFEPNKQILMPETYLKLVGDRWNSHAFEFNIQIKPGTSIEELGEKVRKYFHAKYGRTAEVKVDSDEILVNQMRRFLSLFTMMLTGVALISLAVGGIGITNMMLVSVSERFKEIGLRKALGARNNEIRAQFLIEAMILCGVAGLIGILSGICGYHLVLFMASKLFPQVKFTWVFNGASIILSFVCIVGVGLLSGLVPALRAQRLQVVEALRSE